MRWGLALALALPLWAAPSTAQPAPSAADRHKALVAFEKGRAHLAANRVDEACAQFDEAMQLHPRVGYALNLAECEERRGRLTRAAEGWAKAATLAEQERDNRLALAKDRASKLDARLPRVTLKLATSAPSGTTVTFAPAGGEPVPWSSFDAPTPLDPGSYSFVVRAPQYDERSYDLVVAEGDRKELTVNVGRQEGAPPIDISTEPPPPPPDEDSGDLLEWSDWRTAGVAVAGTGAASLIAGVVLGVVALDRSSDAEEHCNDRDICDAEGIDLRAEALDLAHGSTGTLVAGGVLVAGGAVLFFLPELLPDDFSEDGGGETARASRRASSPLRLRLAPTVGGLVISGRW